MEENASHEHSHKKNSVIKKIRDNPWIISTVVLGILVLVMLTGNIGSTGKVISEKEIGPKAVNFINEELLQGQGEVVLSSVSGKDDYYQVVVDYNGQEVPVYFTKSGYYMGSVLLSVDSSGSSSGGGGQSVSKSDKPVAELFIWSYCPYGVQAQKPFAEVASALGDSADFKVVLYYDGHGEHETQQNKIQACMQELGEEKYWDYASRFVDEIYPKCGSSRDADCDLSESISLMKDLGIDSDAVVSCVESQGASLVEEHYNRAKELGVTGSPTLVVNGVKVSPASRTADAFKESICLGFNNAPSECDLELNSTEAASSGSC